jgi:hypothetical protein
VLNRVACSTWRPSLCTVSASVRVSGSVQACWWVIIPQPAAPLPAFCVWTSSAKVAGLACCCAGFISSPGGWKAWNTDIPLLTALPLSWAYCIYLDHSAAGKEVTQ